MSGSLLLASALAERVVVLAHQGHDFSTANSEHHAAATGSLLETVMVVVGWTVVVLVTGFALKFLVRPGEQSQDHIKHVILRDEPPVRR